MSPACKAGMSIRSTTSRCQRNPAPANEEAPRPWHHRSVPGSRTINILFLWMPSYCKFVWRLRHILPVCILFVHFAYADTYYKRSARSAMTSSHLLLTCAAVLATHTSVLHTDRSRSSHVDGIEQAEVLRGASTGTQANSFAAGGTRAEGYSADGTQASGACAPLAHRPVSAHGPNTFYRGAATEPRSAVHVLYH